MSLPPSDHFNGKTFFYPGDPAGRGWLDVLKWKLTSRAARWPRRVEISPPPLPRLAISDRGVIATWIGHATFLLQTAQGNFLTDPVFSDRVGPVSWLGPRRVHPPGVALADLPRIDAVLLSHDHYDHLDFAALSQLAVAHQPCVFAPLGHHPLLRAAGLTDVVELDWWETYMWPDDLAITLTPARHWSRRRPDDMNRRLWGGFFLRSANHKLYFAGDSGYDQKLFPEIRDRCGTPDLAMLPIGAYEPRWFMSDAHMNPAEAVRAHLDTGARQSVGMHWGTFQLTDEARDAPLIALAEARAAAGVSPEAFGTLLPGESLELPAT